jgi:hypothetical protein
MAALVSNWVPIIKLVYQRLAILANMTNQKLVKLWLTELEPHYATDDFVNFNSIDQVIASVVDG